MYNLFINVKEKEKTPHTEPDHNGDRKNDQKNKV